MKMIKVYHGNKEVYIWPDQIIHIKAGYQNRGCNIVTITNLVFTGGTTVEGFIKLAEEARNS